MKNGWETKKLGDVCSFLNRGVSPKYVEKGGIVVLNQRCVRDHVVSFEVGRRHDIKAKKVSSERLLQAGDVLVNSTGTGTLGRVAQLRDNPAEPTTVDSHVTIVRPLPELFFQEFFGYMLRDIEDELKESGEGCGGQTELNRSVLSEKFLVRFPKSLIEQQRIVGVLDKAFAGLANAQANAEKNLQNARALFASHLQSVFTQRGKGWVDTTLGEEIDLLVGFAFKSVQYTSKEKDIRLLRGDNIIQGCLRWDDVKRWPANDTKEYERYQLSEGDVVLAMDRPWVKAGLKHATISADDLPSLLVQRTARLRGGTNLDNRFLKLLIGSSAFTSHILGVQTGIGVPHISGQQIKDFKFARPPVAEQKRIAKNLESLSEETRRLAVLYERKLAMLGALKNSLLHQAFTGKLTKVPSQTAAVAKSLPLLPPIPNFTPIELHAGILAMGYQAWEQANRQWSFGHVMAEKFSHMTEAMVGLDLGRKPVCDHFGPDDFPHFQKVEHRARMANYFTFQDGNKGKVFVKGRKFESLATKTRTALGDLSQKVDTVIKLMLPLEMQQAEVVATVYAAWNNLLMDNQTPTDEQIVLAARENWHPDKLKIDRTKFFKTIDWIRKKSICPQGKGKKVLPRAA